MAWVPRFAPATPAASAASISYVTLGPKADYHHYNNNHHDYRNYNYYHHNHNDHHNYNYYHHNHNDHHNYDYHQLVWIGCQIWSTNQA